MDKPGTERIGTQAEGRRARGAGSRFASAFAIYLGIFGGGALAFYLVHVEGNQDRINRLAMRSLQSVPQTLLQSAEALSSAVPHAQYERGSGAATADVKVPQAATSTDEPGVSTPATESQIHAVRLQARSAFRHRLPGLASAGHLRNAELYSVEPRHAGMTELRLDGTDWNFVTRTAGSDQTFDKEIRVPLADLAVAPDALKDFDQVLIVSADGRVMYRASPATRPIDPIWRGFQARRDEFTEFVAVSTEARAGLRGQGREQADTASADARSRPLDAGKIAEVIFEHLKIVPPADTSKDSVTALATLEKVLGFSQRASRASAAATHSFVVDESIGAQSYRVFVQPQILPFPVADTHGESAHTVYVVGLITRARLFREMLATPASTLLAAGVLLVIAVCVVPYLKLLLKGPQQHTRRAELYALIYGGLAAAGMAAILLAHFDRHLRNVRDWDHRLLALGTDMRQRAQQEVADILTRLERADRTWAGSAEPGSCASEPGESMPPERPLAAYPQGELMFSADADGSPCAGQHWGTWALKLSTPISDRHYFDAVMRAGRPAVERVFGKATGRYMDIVATAIGNEAGRIGVYAGMLPSLSWVPLPVGFEYAVVDRATGMVAHHSFDYRSGVENYFEEIGNDSRAGALIADGLDGQADFTYHHARQRAYVLQLGPEQAQAGSSAERALSDWALIITYDKAVLEVQEFAALARALLQFLIYLAALALLASLVRLVFGPFSLRWLWFDLARPSQSILCTAWLMYIATALAVLAIVGGTGWASLGLALTGAVLGVAGYYLLWARGDGDAPTLRARKACIVAWSALTLAASGLVWVAGGVAVAVVVLALALLLLGWLRAARVEHLPPAVVLRCYRACAVLFVLILAVVPALAAWQAAHGTAVAAAGALAEFGASRNRERVERRVEDYLRSAFHWGRNTNLRLIARDEVERITPSEDAAAAAQSHPPSGLATVGVPPYSAYAVAWNLQQQGDSLSRWWFVLAGRVLALLAYAGAICLLLHGLFKKLLGIDEVRAIKRVAAEDVRTGERSVLVGVVGPGLAVAAGRYDERFAGVRPIEATRLVNALGEGRGALPSALLVSGFEDILQDRAQVLQVLGLLEGVLRNERQVILIGCAVDPHYWLHRHRADTEEQRRADFETRAALSRVLAYFRVINAADVSQSEASRSPTEAPAWTREKRALWDLHDLELPAKLLDRQASEREAIHAVLRQAWPVYARMWLYSTHEERLALYHLARGRLLNPRAAMTLRSLLARGLIRRAPCFELANESLEEFVLRAEPPERWETFAREQDPGIWPSLRGPVIVTMLLATIVLVYFLREQSTGLIAVLGSVAALVPMVDRLANFARGAGSAAEAA